MSHLVFICGLPGAGKTSLAKVLEVKHSAVRLCPDEWIEPLLRDKSDRTEMDRLRPQIDRFQWSLAKRLLSLGINVIWEQGFWHADERGRYLAEGRSVGAKVSLHYLEVPISELKARVETRNKDLPFGSFYVHPDEIDTFSSWFQPPGKNELLSFDEYHLHTPE